MIHDLNASINFVTRISARVCIIGAGTAGIFLAKLLRQRGIEVTLLDAGGDLSKSPAESGEFCEQNGLLYRGADNGRAFGLGGTSALWGGQMIPLSRSDFSARPQVNFSAWPIGYDDVARFFPLVASAVGLAGVAGRSGAEDEEVINAKFPLLKSAQGDFELRLSSWIPFAVRNFSIAYEKELKDDAGPDVWLNAAVVDIRNEGVDQARVAEVVARSANGRELVVEPEFVVVAAGALESTRLLLAYDEATDSSITRCGSPLGCYFADHISVPCAKFKCLNWKEFNHQVAPIFDRGVMRTPRLELTKDAQEMHRLTSAFAHFTFMTKGRTGFDLVRSIMRRRQGEQVNIAITPSDFFRAAVDIFSMTFWRYFYKRLWIPRKSDLVLQVDIEQLPNRQSRLLLSNDKDKFGRKRLVVDWQITPDDVKVIKRVAELAMAAWKNSSLQNSAEIELAIPTELDSFSTPYDVYHPTGSLQMGSTSSDSVVDGNLRLWASDNIFVSSTAVFPSAGSANPGMTHLALTARLAEHLSNRLGSR